MKRQDHGDIKRCSLLQDGLYLCSVFADDADIVASCFIGPVFFNIQSAELAETIGRKKSSFIAVVSHYDFRPVHHRRCNEVQGVLAKF